MEIKFLQDFRGRETKERYFQAGDVAEGIERAAELIERGIAVEVKPPAPKKPAPKRKPPAKVEGSK